jgi:FlaG/FlaF family flagellin (archaellin)
VVEPIGSGMKILFYILSLVFPLAGFIIGIIYYSKQDPESKHVGKICIILAVVGILVTVGLAAIMYVMVLGFGSVDGNTPVAALTRNTITNGVKITIVSITKTDVPWDDVRIQVSDGTNIAEWSPTKAFQSSIVGHNYSTSAALTGLTVCLWIYDVSGNGYVSGTDYFTLTTSGGPTFSSATTYTVTIVYAPTGSSMTSASFTG